MTFSTEEEAIQRGIARGAELGASKYGVATYVMAALDDSGYNVVRKPGELAKLEKIQIDRKAAPLTAR